MDKWCLHCAGSLRADASSCIRKTCDCLIVSPRCAIAVAISALLIVVWATSVGSLLPLIAAGLRIDPTLVSGPLMSTLVDATGLFIYFSIARLILV